MTKRPPVPSDRQRNALLPGLILGATLLVGIIYIGEAGASIIRFIVAILAVIIAWFAVPAKQWWWLLPMTAVAVLWNPVFPLSFTGDLWVVTHIVAAIVSVAAGSFISIPRVIPEVSRAQ